MAGEVAKAWQAYERKFVRVDTPPGQRARYRKAFYSGMRSLITLLGAALDTDKEPSEADLSRMDAIERELVQYGEDTAAGQD